MFDTLPLPSISSDELRGRISRLAPEARRVLELVVDRARGLALPIAWVGGGVRDLLLEREHPDFDLVVEGDPVALGKTLSAPLGGTLRVHDRFGTATLVADPYRVDLARARREAYPQPAALPAVTPAPLEEDLGRRDFTLNAMAIRFSLDRAAPPEWLDPHGGLRDLRSGELRVLHPRSFEDDPTRILRGIGFELRFGFRLARGTERLARLALEEGLLERLSGERLWKALGRVLERRSGVASALARLRELGALRRLLGPEADVDAAIALAAAAVATDSSGANGAEPDEGADELFLIAVGAGLSREGRRGLAKRLSLPAHGNETLVEAPDRIAGACRRLTAEPQPHEVAELLAPLSPLEIAVARTVGGKRVADWVDLWRSDLRHRESTLSASDLLAAGVPSGPAIGVGLRAARRARIDRDLAPEDELAVALAAARVEEPS